MLERDGWAPYRRFANAKHQTCHAHLLRRTGELIADSVAGQARVPHAARRILKDALALRDQRDVIDAEEFGLRVTDLNERTDKLLAMRPTHEPNRRLLAHLQTEREHMFTFLTEPGVQATNWRAEQALRPAIVNRKSWGGNRTQQRRAHPADHDERDPHRPPTEHRPGRADGQRAALPPAGRQRADQAPRPRVPDQPGGLSGDARADPDRPSSATGSSATSSKATQQTVILDATARAFIAVTGTIDEDGTMHGEGTHAGPLAAPTTARPPDRRRRTTRQLRIQRPWTRATVIAAPSADRPTVRSSRPATTGSSR